HLRSRLDDSFAVVPLPPDDVGFLAAEPDRLQIGALTPAGLRLTDLESGEHRTVPIGPHFGPFVTAAQTRRGLRIAAWVGNTAFDLRDGAGHVLYHVEIPDRREGGRLVVSPDGRWLACGWPDGEWLRLSVFDAKTGKRTAVCDGHRENLWGY